MRYNDKNTQRSCVKQIEKEDLSKSDRNLRRERERASMLRISFRKQKDN